MTRNLRNQLADVAERWMRAWAGDDLPRESAEVLYTYWDLADPHDDELRELVLGRFSAAEPPAVPGLDFLPAAVADAALVVVSLDVPAPAKELPKPRRWRDREGDEWEESGDRLRLAEPGVVSTTDRSFVENAYGPLVEVAQ